jgi:hypothetical protein
VSPVLILWVIENYHIFIANWSVIKECRLKRSLLFHRLARWCPQLVPAQLQSWLFTHSWNLGASERRHKVLNSLSRVFRFSDISGRSAATKPDLGRMMHLSIAMRLSMRESTYVALRQSYSTSETERLKMFWSSGGFPEKNS